MKNNILSLCVLFFAGCLYGQSKTLQYNKGKEILHLSKLTGLTQQYTDSLMQVAWYKFESTKVDTSFFQIYEKLLMKNATIVQMEIVKSIFKGLSEDKEVKEKYKQELRVKGSLNAHTQNFIEELLPEYREINMIIMRNMDKEDSIWLKELRSEFRIRTNINYLRGSKMKNKMLLLSNDKLKQLRTYLVTRSNIEKYTIKSEVLKSILRDGEVRRIRLSQILEKYSGVFKEHELKVISLRNQYYQVSLEIGKKFFPESDIDKLINTENYEELTKTEKLYLLMVL